MGLPNQAHHQPKGRNRWQASGLHGKDKRHTGISGAVRGAAPQKRQQGLGVHQYAHLMPIIYNLRYGNTKAQTQP